MFKFFCFTIHSSVNCKFLGEYLTSWKVYHIYVCVCVGEKAVFFWEINLALLSFLSHNVQFIKINNSKGVVVYFLYKTWF